MPCGCFALNNVVTGYKMTATLNMLPTSILNGICRQLLGDFNWLHHVTTMSSVALACKALQACVRRAAWRSVSVSFWPAEAAVTSRILQRIQDSPSHPIYGLLRYLYVLISPPDHRLAALVGHLDTCIANLLQQIQNLWRLDLNLCFTREPDRAMPQTLQMIFIHGLHSLRDLRVQTHPDNTLQAGADRLSHLQSISSSLEAMNWPATRQLRRLHLTITDAADGSPTVFPTDLWRTLEDFALTATQSHRHSEEARNFCFAIATSMQVSVIATQCCMLSVLTAACTGCAIA